MTKPILAAMFVVALGDIGSAHSQALLPEQACYEKVQGYIPWDHSGNRDWSEANVRRLCRGTYRPDAPGACFTEVMYGGVDWGGGTRWSWENALDLCAGASNADSRIGCFEDQLDQGEPWSEAIASCQEQWTSEPSSERRRQCVRRCRQITETRKYCWRECRWCSWVPGRPRGIISGGHMACGGWFEVAY